MSKHSIADNATEALLDALRTAVQRPSNYRPLWVADEHKLPPNLTSTLADNNGLFISNRFDQHQRAMKGGVQSWFSDIDLSVLTENSIGHIFFRVAKERALVHHLINEASRTLPTGGSLWLAGFKNEGIKTHIERAEERFNTKANITRHKNQLFVGEIAQQSPAESDLPDNDYPVLRQVECGEQLIWSKPGLYGWNKADEASQLLMDFLADQSVSFEGKKILDLGCGYGYLSMRAIDLGAKNIVATDNCTAALAACEKNLSGTNIQSLVVPSNAGLEIDSAFDVILCNPPFHQGFSTTNEMHQKFLIETSRLLSAEAKAWYVVNQFLNIESIAKDAGLYAAEMSRTKSYKIVELTRL